MSFTPIDAHRGLDMGGERLHLEAKINILADDCANHIILDIEIAKKLGLDKVLLDVSILGLLHLLVYQ